MLKLFCCHRSHCKPRGRGSHPTACHLSPGGDGFVQQQAQTEAGSPQPGNRRAHVTPHTERRSPNTHSHTLWNTGKHTGAESLNTTQCQSEIYSPICNHCREKLIVATRTHSLLSCVPVLPLQSVGKSLNSPSRARKSSCG